MGHFSLKFGLMVYNGSSWGRLTLIDFMTTYITYLKSPDNHIHFYIQLINEAPMPTGKISMFGPDPVRLSVLMGGNVSYRLWQGLRFF